MYTPAGDSLASSLIQARKLARFAPAAQAVHLLRRRYTCCAGAAPGATPAAQTIHLLRRPQNRSKGLFWAFRTSNMAVSRGRRRPKQAQNASNIPRSAPDTTYVHCYQSHVASIRPRNRLKMLIPSSILRLSRNTAPIGVSPGTTEKKKNLHTIISRCFRARRSF